MKFCPNCKSLANDSDEFCDVCGTKLEMITTTIKKDDNNNDKEDYTDPFETNEITSIINENTSKKDENVQNKDMYSNSKRSNIITIVTIALLIFLLLCAIISTIIICHNKVKKNNEKVDINLENNITSNLSKINMCSSESYYGNDTASIDYNYYFNERFGFSINIPSIFNKLSYSPNGDGIRCFNINDGAVLKVYGYNNVFNSTAKDEYELELSKINKVVHKDQGDDWYTISYIEGEYEYYLFTKINNSVNSISFKYPSIKSEYYYKIVDTVYNSFIVGDITVVH